MKLDMEVLVRHALVVLVVLAACTEPTPEISEVAQEGNTLQGNTLQGNTLQGSDLASWLAGVEGVSKLNVYKTSSSGLTITLDKVRVEGTQLKGDFGSTTIQGASLVGYRLTGIKGATDHLGNRLTVPLKIDGYATDNNEWNMIDSEIDAGHRSNSNVHLYKVSYLSAGTWKPLCKKRFDASGAETPDSEMATMLPGVWLIENGQYMEHVTQFTVACWSGAIAKCVRFGYKPWKSILGTSLRDLHLSCVRALRADYCGDGRSFTLEGTSVDIYDKYNFIKKENEDFKVPAFAEEASFDPNGSRCIEKFRYDSIGGSCPPSYEWVADDGSGGGPWMKPKLHVGFAYFMPAERADCVSSRTVEQLVLADTSTYCTHSPHMAGKFGSAAAPLASDCSTCTAAVCAAPGFDTCCRGDHDGDGDIEGSWTWDCVAKANELCFGPPPATF